MTILSAALDILAVIAPLTGTRATGTVTMIGDDTTVERNQVIIPVIGGRARTELAFKVGANPDTDDGSWVAAAVGTDIAVFSNIGGARHNMADETEFRLDPPVDSDITSIVAKGAFTDGADATGFGAVKDAVIYDQINGPVAHVDLKRSALKAFPGIVLAWMQSDPADGATIKTRRRTSRESATYREQFQMIVITSREDSEHTRRSEGLYIMEEASRWLTNRNQVDGRSLSNPDGVNIQRRWRMPSSGDYQKFSLYSMAFSVEQTMARYDARTWHDWETAVIDVLKPHDDGDLTLVDDMTVEMQ